jgi:hypothetical protein
MQGTNIPHLHAKFVTDCPAQVLIVKWHGSPRVRCKVPLKRFGILVARNKDHLYTTQHSKIQNKNIRPAMLGWHYLNLLVGALCLVGFGEHGCAVAKQNAKR